MTDSGIILPWWLLSLFAGMLLTVLAWKREALRRGCQRLLAAAVTNLRSARDLSLQRANSWRNITDRAFSGFTDYLSAMRYRLAVVDFMRLLTSRWQRVENICSDADALIARASDELENAKMEKPEAPDWAVAADALSRLPVGSSQPATAKILEAMLDAAQNHHEETLREFRWSVAVRGRALLESSRYWRGLTARMSSIEAYWCDVRRASERLSQASQETEKRLSKKRHRFLLQGVFHGVLATVVLLVSGWLSIFLLEQLSSQSAGVGSSSVQGVWPTVFLLVLLVLGTLLASAFRWAATFPPVAELSLRWRAWIAAVSVCALLYLSINIMQQPAADLQAALVAAGWSNGNAAVAGGLLYGVPVLLSFQLCLVELWLRAARPLTLLALELVLRSLHAGLHVAHALALFLHGLVSREQKPAFGEGIKLISDNSAKKTGAGGD